MKFVSPLPRPATTHHRVYAVRVDCYDPAEPKLVHLEDAPKVPDDSDVIEPARRARRQVEYRDMARHIDYSRDALLALAGSTPNPNTNHTAVEWLDQTVQHTAPVTGMLDGLLSSPHEDVVRLVARVLHLCEGSNADPMTELARELPLRLGLPRRASLQLDPSLVTAFLKEHASELRTLLLELRNERIARDVELMQGLAEDHPQNSYEELRRVANLDQPHLTRRYFDTFLAARLARTRPIDRMGDEPNLPLVAKLAYEMLSAPPGTTERQVLEDAKQHHPDIDAWWPKLSVRDLDTLASAYPLLPRWPPTRSRGPAKSNVCPDTTTIDPRLYDELLDLRRVPLFSPLLDLQQAIRGETNALAGREVLTVELALADVVAYLRELISVQGASGDRITVVWKPYADDPSHAVDRLIPSLCERTFGIRSIVPTSNDELLATLDREIPVALARAAAHGGGAAVHLLGTDRWATFDEAARAQPDVSILAVSHTKSDAQDLRATRSPPNATTVVMAESQPKERYEGEHMLATVFTRLLFDLEAALNLSLRERRFVVHGFGPIGQAVTRALDQFGVYPGQVSVTDPKLDEAGGDARLRGLAGTRGVRVLPFAPSHGREPTIARAFGGEALVSINATPKHVLTQEMLEQLPAGRPLVHFQVGSGQKDHELLERLAFDPALGGPNKRDVGRIGRMRIYRYEITLSSGAKRTVFLPGDGKVLNHSYRSPNPTSRTDFISLLKLESFCQAAWAAKHDPGSVRVLESVQVAWREEDQRAQPIVALLDRTARHTPETDAEIRHAAAEAPWDAPLALVDLTTRRS